MAPVPRLARALLVVGGGVVFAAGIAGVAVGLLIPDRLEALLPPVAVDAAAIGGASVALGVLLLAAGLVQATVGLLLGRGDWAHAAGAVILGLLGALLLAVAVAMLTEVGAGAPAWLVAPGLALASLALLYGTAAWRLAGVAPRAPDESQRPR